MSENISNLSQALISSMEILAKSGDQSLSFDKTIECTIVKVVDPATGEYKVRYLNGTISAYDISLEMKYKAGDEVYVQVPQNDMSLKKLIVGKKSIKASDLVDVILDTERVDKIGLPIESIYGLSEFIQENGIIGSTLPNRNFYISFYERENTKELLDSDILLQNYAANQDLLLIEAQFKTSWFEDGLIQGNYGLELTFNLKEAGQYVVVLDRQGMRGNSLKYDDWTSISGLLNIEGNKIESLQSVKLFAENFIRNKYTEEDLQEKWRNGDYEILVKNISVNFVKEAKTLGYTVNIRTPDGIYFDALQTKNLELRLQALFKYNGQELKTSKAKYSWWRRNSRIDNSHADFNELAGVGWQKIDGDTAINSISLDAFGQNTISQMYKVIVEYEEFICENEIILYRTLDSDNYELYLTKDTNNIGRLTLKKQNSDEKIVFTNASFDWTSIDNNGLATYYSTKTDEISTYISDDGLSLNNIYLDNIIGFTTFYCSVFAENGTPIVTVYETVQNVQIKQDFDVIFLVDNDGFYSYNSKGDYVSENVNKKIDFVINWKNDPVAFYYQWIPTTDIETDNEGNDFLSYKNKMFEGVENQTLDGEVDPNFENSSTQQPFYFTVKNRYQAEKSENNIIQLNIIIDGITYSFRKNLTFLKEGSSGTNGTSLMLKIEPAEDSNVALLPQQGSSIVLKCTLYYNGSATYGNSSVSDAFDVEASIPYDYWGVKADGETFLNPFIRKSEDDEKFVEELISFETNTTDPNHIYIQITTKENLTYNLNDFGFDGANFNSIIQLKFTPKPGRVNFNHNLYKLYPVPLVQLSDINNTEIAKYFVTGAKEVLYDANGYNPSYAESGYKIYSDTTVTDLKQFVTFGRYADSQGFTLNGTERTILPWTYYSKNEIGAIYFSFNNSDYYTQPIVFGLNLFSESLLNAWDGASLQIDEKNNSILAAQIGAGKKDSDNKFTGVLMGQYSGTLKSSNGSLSSTGLLGFHKGESTFGLLDSGDAFFGRSGMGRIEFLTSSNLALIQSGNYIPSSASGIVTNYVIKTSTKLTHSNSDKWTDRSTANMIISFDNNGTTSRGRNLNNSYFSVGGPSTVDGSITSYTFFKIKLKEKDVTTKTLTSYYQAVNTEGKTLYKKDVINQVETTIKELTDGGWKSSRNSVSTPVETGTEITKEVYDTPPPPDVISTTSSHYYLYIYERNSTVVPYEYVRFDYKDSNLVGTKGTALSSSTDEIYTNETFVISTSTAQGGGMQINLSNGQIDAADFKLQSKTILINSQIKYYCDNKSCINYNKHLLLNGTCEYCGNDLVPYLGDYAIKVGSDINAFYICHDGTGMIGGWKISKDANDIWSLYAGDTYLSSAGEIVGARLQGGTISGSTITGSSVGADYLSANYGIIGGWTIVPGGLFSGEAYLQSNGSLAMGSGNFITKISSSGVQIGHTMAINSTSISMYAGGLGSGETKSNLYFYIGYNGIELVQSSYSQQNSKLKLGWDSNESDTNIYPYLRLGAGAGDDSNTFWLKKYSTHWWMGNQSATTGIEIHPTKMVFKGTTEGITAKLVT